MPFFRSFLLGGFLFFLMLNPAIGQENKISGVILSGDDQSPIPNANIKFSLDLGTVSDIDGMFEISGLEKGIYTLNISSIGFENHTEQVSLGSSDKIDLRIILTPKVYQTDVAVVTATRTEKSLADVSAPVIVVSKEEIERTGSRRLGNILEEQIGMNLVTDHGTGVQLQGFDPDYTLILIDNQPVIGRTAGTLDLNRLAIGNVEQIEIVKGPSSALWGSEALAGVINIITEKGNSPLNAEVNARYASNATFDGSGNIQVKRDQFSARFFGNYTQSKGFDLDESTISPTIPEYSTLTLMGGSEYKFSEFINFGIESRYYLEQQSYLSSSENLVLKGDDNQFDYSISPIIKFNFDSIYLLELSGFFSRFKSESNLVEKDTNDPFSFTSFDQTLNRIEFKNSFFWKEQHISVFGAGMNREDLIAEIYADVPFFDSYFAFGQHEWNPVTKVSLTGGFRFDSHSEYKSQLTPKFSALYKASDKLTFKGSLGGGFKAPDFRQLFLNFTNPIAGYSVFGTSTIIEGINLLEENGEIDEIYYNPEEFTNITPEYSFSYNLGADYSYSEELKLSVNGFRNNVRDLIETERVALKTNGQSVFSYINLNRIFTQGAEAIITLNPKRVSSLSFSFGYQYLDARRKITETSDQVVNGQVITVSEQKYVQLFNRSKHTWNFKTFYRIQPLDIETSLRIQYRGKYGFADFNSNQIVDETEFAEAHAIVNATISKSFKDRVELLIGANNLLNYTDMIYLPSNPGITLFAQININLY